MVTTLTLMKSFYRVASFSTIAQTLHSTLFDFNLTINTIAYIFHKAQTPLVRFVVDCCGFVVQQIHNKSKQVKLGLNATASHEQFCILFNHAGGAAVDIYLSTVNISND